MFNVGVIDPSGRQHLKFPGKISSYARKALKFDQME